MRLNHGWRQSLQLRLRGFAACPGRRAKVMSRSASTVAHDIALQIETLEDRSLLSVVGFVDDREFGSGDADYIKAAGHTPVQLTDADLTPDVLNQLDALILALGNWDRPESLLANFSNVLDWVNAGGALIIHDSNPGANADQDVVPGLDDAIFVYSSSSEMNVLNPESLIVKGPFGTVTDTTLDNGSSSNHGYVMAESLPGDVDQVMDADFDTSHIAVMQYAFGNGTVIYTTIPAEFYTNYYGDNWDDFDTQLEGTYLGNELNAALTATNPTGEYVPADLVLPEVRIEVNNEEDAGGGDNGNNDDNGGVVEDNGDNEVVVEYPRWNVPAGQIVVGFLDDREYCSGNSGYIAAAGFMPVQLTDGDLDPVTLSQLDVLVLALGNEDRPESLMANFPNVLDWVNAGGALIIHDSNPGANEYQDIVPGLDGAIFVGLYTSQEMNVLNPNSPIMNGPFGTVTDGSLDNGISSNHGYVLAESLPESVDQVMNTDFESSHIAVMQYGFGSGNVIYSTIPAEFYTFPDWGGWEGFDFATQLVSIYLPNELYAALAGAIPAGAFRGAAIDQTEDVVDEVAADTIIGNVGGGLLVEDNFVTEEIAADEPDPANDDADEFDGDAPQEAWADNEAFDDGLLVADVAVDFTEIVNCC